MESGETNRECCVAPEFSANQCIFYPVKEEEREVLLGPAQTSGGSSTPESTDVHQTEHQTTDSASRELLTLFRHILSAAACIGSCAF